jgi:hypothetical protein
MTGLRAAETEVDPFVLLMEIVDLSWQIKGLKSSFECAAHSEHCSPDPSSHRGGTKVVE